MVADGGERRGVGGERIERCSSEDTGGTARRARRATLEVWDDLASGVPLRTRAPARPATGPAGAERALQTLPARGLSLRVGTRGRSASGRGSHCRYLLRGGERYWWRARARRTRLLGLGAQHRPQHSRAALPTPAGKHRARERAGVDGRAAFLPA